MQLSVAVIAQAFDEPTGTISGVVFAVTLPRYPIPMAGHLLLLWFTEIDAADERQHLGALRVMHQGSTLAEVDLGFTIDAMNVATRNLIVPITVPPRAWIVEEPGLYEYVVELEGEEFARIPLRARLASKPN